MGPFLPATDPQAYTVADIGTLIHNLIIIALDVTGLLASIYIIIGAFLYLTAFGDESKAESGKKTITWAIIGLVMVILSQVAVGELFRLFGGTTPTLPT